MFAKPIQTTYRLHAILCLVSLVGCYQPYYQPYQPSMYGQPPYGAPAPVGVPYGQPLAPTQMAPGISSVPSDGFYAPSPTPDPFGSDAPAFQPPIPGKSPDAGNSVPRYNDPSSESPYFESSSFRPHPGPNSSNGVARVDPMIIQDAVPEQVAQANFAEPAGAAREIDLSSVDQFQSFEPPITQLGTLPQNRTPTREKTELPPADLFASTPAASDPKNSHISPFATEQNLAAVNEPRPMPPASPFELAAPPLNDTPATDGDAIEGIVKYLPADKTWVLSFPAAENGPAPFGGQLPLMGNPQILSQLQDGKMFRLTGVLQTTGDNQARLQIQQIQPL